MLHEDLKTRVPPKRGRHPWRAVASRKVQVKFLPSYLRRDATALGLLLLSMLDITSSFL
jgi:hypothetical protein